MVVFQRDPAGDDAWCCPGRKGLRKVVIPPEVTQIRHEEHGGTVNQRGQIPVKVPDAGFRFPGTAPQNWDRGMQILTLSRCVYMTYEQGPELAWVFA